MDGLPVRVGLLRAPDPADEWHAAADWCAGIADAADPVSLSAVSKGTTTLDHDVLWWHAPRPLAGFNVDLTTVGEHLRSYVESGGGLLLTLRALAAVVPFGIDPVGPDMRGAGSEPSETGYLTKTIHRDHPVFETFHDTRIPLAGPDSAVPFARYEAILPSRGDVLACGYRGEHDAYERKPLIEWRPGDGGVIGAGSHLWFGTGDTYAGARRRLAQNALATLGRNYRHDPWARPVDPAAFRALRKALSTDHHRPRYHVSPPANWLNDPNGLIYWNDRYHLFYQYNPGGPFHDTIHWGHVVSDDLVEWTDEPVALAPDPDGPDRDGCWSGCAVDDNGSPTLIYTGGRNRRQLPCLATTDDPELRTWTTGETTIIDSPPDHLDVYGDYWEAEFRDHSVWREDGRWWHLIGSGIEGEGGTALLYVGDELDTWEFVGRFLTGSLADGDEVWECPELLTFPSTDERLLHVSESDQVTYWIGKAELADDDPGFEPRKRGVLDYGDFYAPQSMWDGEAGRYLTWGWLPEARSAEAQWEAGWSGMLSLPRVITLTDGELRQRPAPELQDLRKRSLVDETIEFDASRTRPLCQSESLELALDVRLEGAEEAGLILKESPAAGERTVVRYTGDAVVVDRSASSLDPHTDPSEQHMPVGDGPLSLRVFVDGSVMELYANDRRCLTSRIYPTRKDATGVLAYAHGDATLEIHGWNLSSIWPTPTGR